MDLNEYQKLARRTAHKVKIESEWAYPMFGLAGEVGELINKAKKVFRDDHGVVSAEKKKEVLYELGDVLWYVSEIASQFDVSLEEVAKMNVEKLAQRLQKGTITGSGDHR